MPDELRYTKEDMLQLSGSLLNRPILSLRSGEMVGTTISAIINPNNLKIEGFFCSDADNRKRKPVLLYQDIRDIIVQGIVVNDHDVLADPSELPRLGSVLGAKFEILGKTVITTRKEKIGKVADFATEVETMYIQKIYVSQSVLKNLTGGNLSIDRNQIVEITDKRIVIQDLGGRVPARASALA
jgi:uncharacterized protein YrrD